MADTALKTNENETEKGVNETRPMPSGRHPGTNAALWGDEPETSAHTEDTNTSAVKHEAYEGRGGLLDRIFDHIKSESGGEKSLMRKHFVHAGQGNPHSPMLQHGEKNASDMTLTDQVMKIAGRR